VIRAIDDLVAATSRARSEVSPDRAVTPGKLADAEQGTAWNRSRSPPAAVAVGRAPAPTVLVTSADAGAAIEGLEVVRQIDVNELSERASRGGLARLSANQRILSPSS
jgi:hypothetical protein